MPTEPKIDLDALTAKIPGDDPAGQPLSAGLQAELGAVRPRISKDGNKELEGDWPKVIQLTTQALETTGKDLLVAAWLTEALTHRDGFAGLRDGLRLLARLFDECWDRMYPKLDKDTDASVRRGPIDWLNDQSRGAKLPYAVAVAPLVKLQDGRSFHLFDWQNANRRPACEAILAETDRAAVQVTVEDLRQCRDALRQLSDVLDRPDRLAGGGPDLASTENPSNLGQAVQGCLVLAEQMLSTKGGYMDPNAAAAASTDGAVDGAAPAPIASPITGTANDRVALYRQLEQTAAALRRLEPHSPIPFLIQRCVALGRLEFPELMKRIVRTEGALSEIDRLIGLEDVSSSGGSTGAPSDGGAPAAPAAPPGPLPRRRPPHLQ